MFNHSINSRIKLVLLFFLSFFIVIFLKVVYIEMVDYQKLVSLANDLWSRDLPVEASRGLILDRNGVVLADNITTTSLVLVPNQITNKEEVSKVLSEILNVSVEEMNNHVYKKNPPMKQANNKLGFKNRSQFIPNSTDKNPFHDKNNSGENQNGVIKIKLFIYILEKA